jgi:type I restriction enzyme S subunit
MFNWVDRIAYEAFSARRLIDLLDQAVLTRAFKGELVPQDPNEEPATTLLERIKTRKHKQPRRNHTARSDP